MEDDSIDMGYLVTLLSGPHLGQDGHGHDGDDAREQPAGARVDVQRLILPRRPAVGPGRYCSPHQRLPCNFEGPTCMSMTWRVMGQAVVAPHVIGCNSTHETRVTNACR
jgi:hypothetical protein